MSNTYVFLHYLHEWMVALIEGNQNDIVSRRYLMYNVPLDDHTPMQIYDISGIRSLLMEHERSFFLNQAQADQDEDLTRQLRSAQTAQCTLAGELEHERRMHNQTNIRLNSLTSEQQTATDQAVSNATKDLHARLTELTAQIHNLNEQERQTKASQNELHVRHETLLKKCRDIEAERDEADATTKELLRAYQALMQSCEQSEHTVRDAIECEKENFVLARIDGIVLSRSTVEAIHNRLRHFISTLLQQRDDLQHNIRLSMMHNTQLTHQLAASRQWNDGLRKQIHMLECDQATRRNIEQELRRDLQLSQTNGVEARNAAAASTIASIDMLSASQPTRGQLKRKVRLLEHENDVIWEHLLEQGEQESAGMERTIRHSTVSSKLRGVNAQLPSAEDMLREVGKVFNALNEAHRHYYVLH
ncbi:hypothetical protein Slin14017_G125100 [Septoria linicola]|nr:hypothetical protein Slin14017_G125100 [Septoria linicola]